MGRLKLYGCCLFLLYSSINITFADPLAPAPVPPVVSATTPLAATTEKEFLGLNYTGYIDGSYNYLVRSNTFTSGNVNRVFDLNQNGFTLQQAALIISHQPVEGLGGLVNPMIGRDAYEVSAYGINPNATFDSQNLGTTWLQAYLQYAHGPFTVLVGQFLALEGLEQINPTLDTNFSRSVLFYSTPDTNTGIRGIYVVNDKLTLTAGLNNGWNSITDWSRHKTIEFGASFTLDPLLSFSVQGLTGQQRVTNFVSSGPVGQRTLIDLVATLHATPKLSFAANYDNGWQSRALLPNGSISKAIWQGFAGYVNYTWNDNWQSSFRGEIFEDSSGYNTGVRQNWREVTLTIGYSPIKNLQIHAETRHDFSNVNSFLNTNRATANNNQQSFALEAYYQI